MPVTTKRNGDSGRGPADRRGWGEPNAELKAIVQIYERLRALRAPDPETEHEIRRAIKRLSRILEPNPWRGGGG